MEWKGTARSLAVQALDRLKNRYTAPGPADAKITLEGILAPGKDVSRWKVKEGAEIVGYVWDVKRGGIESTNCHARDDTERDTHIELVLDPTSGGPSRRMIGVLSGEDAALGTHEMLRFAQDEAKMAERQLAWMQAHD